jgi:hypothetical protein
MSSYESEALFLASLPVSERFPNLKSLMDHCLKIQDGRERILTLAQGLLAHMCDFDHDPVWSFVVHKCVETLRKIPDDSHANIEYYARRVEECCLV